MRVQSKEKKQQDDDDDNNDDYYYLSFMDVAKYTLSSGMIFMKH